MTAAFATKSFRFVSPRLACLLALLIGLASVSADHGWGEGVLRSEPTSRFFDIPAQPLASALETYARLSGIEVLYESSIVASLQSEKIEGEYTSEMALQLLLSRTELKVRYARQNAITLSLPFSAEDNLPPTSPLADADLALDTLQVTDGSSRADARMLREFSETVQSDLERALRQNASTRTGSYKASINLWIDPTRKIRTVGLLNSTGNTERDASIPSALQGVVLSRAPPSNTPQPVKVVITVRSL